MKSYLPSLFSSGNSKTSKLNCVKKLFFLIVCFLFVENKTIAQWDQTNLPNVTLPATGNVGIGFPSGASLLAKFHLQNNGLGKAYDASSSAKGLLLENSTETSTTTTETQSSPPIVLIGHGLKPAVGTTPAADKLIDYKIDVSNTSTPFGGGNVLWGPDYSAFRIQRRSASTDIYSDFFSVSAKIDAIADLSLRLGQTKILSNSSGTNIIHGHSSSGGTIGFYNQPGSVMYGRLLTEGANAGNFTIGGNPASANSSALLQLESTTRGFLMPRMTGSEMNAIVTPAEGLMVYNKSGDAKSPYYYDGAKWNKVGDAAGNPNVMYVSPLQFGAKFNGIDDDIAALDATYAYCKSLPYDKQVIIQMPPGVCRITRPWIIGAEFVDEQYCFFNMYPTYGRGYPPTYNATQATIAAQSKMVSIEGSGSTALYLDFTDDQSIQAGIYYSAYSNSIASLELHTYHISGIGFYGKGYFFPNSTTPFYTVVNGINKRRFQYSSHNNKQIGILAPTPSGLQIDNCTFRDLKEGVVFNNTGAVSFKNSFIESCQRGYYCWSAHGSIIENISVDFTETAFEIRSGSMTVNNIYTRFCPVSLWVGGGTNTFNACYFECGGFAIPGQSQVIIGDDPGDLIPTEFPTANFDADAINFNSLTIAAFSTSSGDPAYSLWMKKSAKRLAIRGGYLQSSAKKMTAESSNELILQGVAGTFTDYYQNGVPTGNLNMTGRVSVQDNNGSFKTMKLTGMATTSETGLRPLFVDQAGNIVVQ